VALDAPECMSAQRGGLGEPAPGVRRGQRAGDGLDIGHSKRLDVLDHLGRYEVQDRSAFGFVVEQARSVILVGGRRGDVPR
jgi:hypothetical protein